MSLFKTREWWATTVGEAEEFDHGCLCVGNIDNEPSGSGQCVFLSHKILFITSTKLWMGYNLLQSVSVCVCVCPSVNKTPIKGMH